MEANRTADVQSNVAGQEQRSQFSAYRALRLLETSLVHVILVIGALAFIFPFYWLIITSIKSNAELFIWPPTLIPRTVELFHYGDALQEVPILRYMGNSTYLTVLNLIGVLISSSLVAFGFTRYHVPGSRILFAALLATMMLPHHVTMIPLFLVFRALGWVDTFRPLWVPAFLGNAFFIFLLRQFFASIPSELFDAARIDGSSEFGQYWRIMLPLSKPALTTVAIFQFQWTWNDFLNPLIYINSQSKKTIALGLQDFYKSQTTVEWQQLMAASVLMVAPVVLVFFFLQRYFIEGIALTGLKG
ncbi:MAG: carbohydrate ABC transporter permease [Chloroflexota bacterium]|nr:carbohydrate ABC transporter permease [Chloroflexota bacterium]